MKIAIKKGTTSKLLDVFIQDSSSTIGAGLTGLAFNTAGLTAYYYREGAASSTAITLATMTLGTWATGGFVVVDGTNMPGCYQLGIPDAALATGANSVLVMLKGAANMAPLVLEIQLTDVDLNDAVRMGMTALPNAASGSAGAVITSGTGTAQLSTSSGLVTLAGVTHTGAVIPTVTTLTNLPAITAGWLTATGIAASALNGKGDWNVGKTGYSLSQSFPANFASMAITAGGAVTVGTNNDKSGYDLSNAGIDAVLNRQLTEGYAAVNAPPTLAQALHMIYAQGGQFAISGTTITCKKLDGTTTSMTFTLDSSTSPTSRSRTT